MKRGFDKMNMKLDILNEIEAKSSFFQKVNQEQYKTRCPYCGDSSNPSHGHLYLKCSNDLSEPILYHCFLCNKSGKVNQAFLDKYGIQLKFPETIRYFNKISNSNNIKNIYTGEPIINSNEYRYLVERLNCQFSAEELSSFRIVWNMNNILESLSNDRIRNTLPSSNNGVSFLSDNNSLLLTRFYQGEPRWRKTTLFPSDNKSLYRIKKNIDLFKDCISVNISEGIFDAIGLYKHFPDENGIYIATLGSDYISAIDYSISLGLIGSHISINLYLDSDIKEKSLIHSLKKYKWLYLKISIFKNALDKDFGVPKERIKLIEFKV